MSRKFIGHEPTPAERQAMYEFRAEIFSADMAGYQVKKSGRVAALRKTATLAIYCACGRNLAFLAWQGGRPLLWYVVDRGPGYYLWVDGDGERALRWPDGDAPAVGITCPKCEAGLELPIAELADHVNAGPNALRDTITLA